MGSRRLEISFPAPTEQLLYCRYLTCVLKTSIQSVASVACQAADEIFLCRFHTVVNICRLRAPSADCTFSVARVHTPSDLWHPSFVQTTEPAGGRQYEDLRVGEN
jgi:hypothetical protein